jgi:hypothetical protein
MSKIIAAIAPCNKTGGFYWGTDRQHFLLDPSNPDEVYEVLYDYYVRTHPSRGVAGELRAESWARRATDALLSGEAPEYGWDVALVDMSKGITDDWPSAGDPSCWLDDVYQGIADYLSYHSWCRLLGERPNYTFPKRSELSDRAAAICDEYLPAGWDQQ